MCVCVNCDIVMKDSNQHVISVVVIKHFGHYKSDSNITTSCQCLVRMLLWHLLSSTYQPFSPSNILPLVPSASTKG